MTLILDAETPTGTVAIIAHNRRELVAALLDQLDPDTVDLPALAAACLDVQPLDVIILTQ